MRSVEACTSTGRNRARSPSSVLTDIDAMSLKIAKKLIYTSAFYWGLMRSKRFLSLPVNDMFAKYGHVRPDSRIIHDM